ncbi:toll/interleukin-1 receptor domain-containing protein [Streptomyces sp. NPDC012637]|uniref:toll/interleukin-1 receptor domain-containing protein n=1 Tax=Streptomyces sp. NPDC012637 TaxID=3364842 RepID=UPI0036E3B5AF
MFVSHGSGKDPEVARALSILEPRLSERGYDVFVDVEKLRVGESWNPALFEEMYLCDAAVVLLGPQTIEESDWVRREADVLMSRHVVRSLRTVLPCFIGTKDTARARRRGFGALLALQAELGQRERNPLPQEALTERIIDWILDEFAPVAGKPGDQGFLKWTKRIASFLRSARVRDADSLSDAAEELQCSSVDRLHVRASVGAELFLAHMMFRAGELVRDTGASLLPDALAALRSGLESGQLLQLADELLPSWADPDDSQHFAPPHPPEADACGPLVLLRAYSDWSATQHISRAVCNAPRSYHLRALPACEDVPLDESSPYDALMESCHAALEELFAVPPGMGLCPERVHPRPKTREYLVIDSRGYELGDVARVVNALHADYEWLVIVVLCPEEIPEQKVLDDLSLSRAIPVCIPQEIEMRAHAFKQELDSVVRKAS